VPFGPKKVEISGPTPSNALFLHVHVSNMSYYKSRKKLEESSMLAHTKIDFLSAQMEPVLFSGRKSFFKFKGGRKSILYDSGLRGKTNEVKRRRWGVKVGGGAKWKGGGGFDHGSYILTGKPP
jgi:hypothetical protein